MKKVGLIIMSAAMLLSSCNTGAGAGAYAGSSLGSILGSAIGGIAGGARGSDVGTIIGMAGGAMVGAAMGNTADKQQQRYQQQSYDIDPTTMVDNSNSGDDRIDFSTAETKSMEASRVESISSPSSTPNDKLTIKHVRFVDTDGDGCLTAEEMGKVVFEIYNDTPNPIYNFEPSVTEANGNRRIYISPSVRIEHIMPGEGLRYTATVKADRRIKNGEARLLVSTQKDGRPISYVTVLKVATMK